jgi:hypothetical protein
MELVLFECPVYRARLTAKGCADNRRKPLLTEGAGTSPMGGDTSHRHPKCGEACPTWLEQQGKVLITINGPAPAQLPPQQEGQGSAWDLVSKATGCATHTALAKKIKKWQGQVSRVFSDLSKGRTPRGEVWEKILHVSKLSAEQLLSAQPAPPAPEPPLADLEGETTSEATGLGADLSADTESHTYHAPPVLMGADPAEQLMTGQELDTLAQQAPSLPEDFVQFVPLACKSALPALSITRNVDITINARAVRQFGLADARHARLYWSAQRGQLAIQMCDPAPDAVAIQAGEGDPHRTIAGKLALRRFGVQPVTGRSFELTLAPGGLLVATIELQQPQAGEEAA